MDLTQEYWWKISLELKLRKVSGDAFQEFFSDVMQKLHGDDFVRVRPFGSKGDKGCDGYLQSNGQVFQCYGAINGDGGKVNYLIGKMNEDFEKAKKKLGSIMKEWHMVHNLVDGLPIDAVEVLEKLKKENPDIKFGFVGLEGFEERINALEDDQVESLLGPVATNDDARNLQIEELRDLVSAVAKEAQSMSATGSSIEPVPADKLDANDLPGHWRSLIAGGWQSAHLVASYLDRHPEPLVGERIARLFNERYQYLKAQNLPPGSIMTALYELVTGVGTVSPERQVAAQALLAHLFESCDIFENVTAETTA
jgi:hypothetical protein